MSLRHARRGIARTYRRHRTAGLAPFAAFLAVLGPGLIAGLSDDDPAGITTYSILGAHFGYTLLWTVPLATALLVLFHLLGARLGMHTGKGFVAVVRDRLGTRAGLLMVAIFIIANFGTICAEYAGIGAAASLAHITPAVAILPIAFVLGWLVVRSNFHRIERVLLALSALLAVYLITPFVVHPDWSAVARGVTVPGGLTSSEAVVAATAVLGTTLAPWGLSFIQSYTVDKGLKASDMRLEKWDVISGAVLTGVIGIAIAITCAATLHVGGVHIDDASDVARALEPLVGKYAPVLFGIGLLAAAVLAAAVVPIATAYSITEGVGYNPRLGDKASNERLFFGCVLGSMTLGALVASIPGLPLIEVIYLSQVINAVVLAPQLIVLVRMNSDPKVVGKGEELSRTWQWLAYVGIVVVVASVVTLLISSVT